MVPVELESMIVRLVGNAESYLNMMDLATRGGQATAAKIGEFVDQIQQFGKNIVSFAKNAASALSSIGVGTNLWSAFLKFEDADLAARRLATSIEMTGGDVKETTARFTRFAEEMAATTQATKAQTLAMLQQATVRGLNDEQAMRAARNAIAMSQPGEDPSSHMRAATMLAQGILSPLLARSLGIHGVKDETEKLALAQEKLDRMYKDALVIGQSVSAQLTRMRATFALLTKEVGALLAEAIRPTVDWLQKMVEKFKALDPFTRRIVVWVVTVTSGILALAGILPTVTYAFELLGSAVAKLFAGVFLNPWTLVFAGIALVIGIVVDRMGGWEKAWETVKEASRETFDWLRERFDELRAIGTQVWKLIQEEAGPVWAWLKDTVIDTFDTVVDWSSQATDAVASFIEENRSAVLAVLSVAAAVGAGVLVYKVLAFTLGFLNGLYYALHLNKLVDIALWVAWKVVVGLAIVTMNIWSFSMLAAKAVAWMFWGALMVGKGLLIALDFLLFTGPTAQGIWSAGVLIAKGVTWLWNSALSVMNALLMNAPILILAAAIAVATFAAIVAGATGTLFGLGTMAVGVWAALTSVWDTLLSVSLAGAGGPLKAVADVFRDWWQILKEVYAVAQIDLPLAWEILKTAALLAVQQIRDLWNPLWVFVGNGFYALGVFAKDKLIGSFFEALDSIEEAFKEMFVKVLKALIGVAVSIPIIIAKGIGGADIGEEFGKKIRDAFAGGKAWKADAIKAGKEAADVLNAALKDATDKFNAAQKGSPEADALKAKLDELREKAKALVALGRGVEDKAGQEREIFDWNQRNAVVQKNIDLKKELEHIDAVAFGSAEARRRTASYLVRLENSAVLSKAGGPGVAGAGDQHGGRMVALLENIRDDQRQQGNQGIPVLPAGLNA